MLDTETKGAMYATLLTALNNRLQPPPMVQDGGVVISPDGSWRSRAREAVQTVVNPHVLDWMEDDEGTSDALIIERALSTIQNRFQRYEVDLNTGCMRLPRHL